MKVARQNDASHGKILKIIENLSLFDDELMTLVFDNNILATELLPQTSNKRYH